MGEPRKYYFDHIEVTKQDEALTTVRMNATQSLMISRMDRHVDPLEFKKLLPYLPGKPKTLFSLAKYSDHLLYRSLLVSGFDTPQDKRLFMHVFRMLYPDYWVQETSKILKFFILTPDG